MNYVTIKNGVASPIQDRKQLYYVSRWKTVFHKSFKEPTNINEQIAIFNQLNNKITIPANTKSKLLITVKCKANDLSSGYNGLNRYIFLDHKVLLGHYYKVSGEKQLTILDTKTNIFGMNIRNIEYNFNENGNVTGYENSNYITTTTFISNVLGFAAERLDQSAGGDFEYNPSILDIKFLIYK